MTTEKNDVEKLEEQPPPGGRRRRRWLRALVILLLLAVAGRLLLPVAAPFAVDGVASLFGLRCDYDDLDLGLLAGEVRLRGLVVASRDEPEREPYLQLGHAHVDVDVLALLTGTIRVRTLQADRVDLRLEREADGSIPLLGHLPESEPTGEADETSEPVDPEAPLLPFEIVTARLQHVRVRVADASTTPPVDTWIDAHVRLDDFGSAETVADLQVYAHGPDFVDRASIVGRIDARTGPVDARVWLDVRGIHPGAAAAWLDPLGIEPGAHRVDISGEAHASAERGTSGIRATVELGALRVAADDRDAITVERVAIDARGLGGEMLVVESIDVGAVRVRAERTPERSLRLAGLDLRPLPRDASVEAASEPPVAGPPPSMPRIRARLDALTVSGVDVRLHDAALETPQELVFSVDEAELTGVALDDAQPTPTARFSIRARLPGIAEETTVVGTLALHGRGAKVAADMRVGAITLERLAPYMREIGLESSIANGTIACGIDAGFEFGDAATVAAASVRDVALSDGHDLLRVRRIDLPELSFAHDADSLALPRVDVEGVRLPVRVTPDGTAEIAGVRLREPDRIIEYVSHNALETILAAVTVPGATGIEWRADVPQIEIGTLFVRDVAIGVLDEGTTPPTAIGPAFAELEITGLALGGHRGDAPRAARLRAEMAVQDMVDRLSATGDLISRPGPPDFDLDLDVRGVGLRAGPLAAYAKRSGIEVTVADGVLQAGVDLGVHAIEGALGAELAVRDVALGGAGQPPTVSVAEVAVTGFELRPNEIVAQSAVVREPCLRVGRDDDGAIDLGVARLVEPDASPAPSGPAQVVDRVAEPEAAEPSAASGAYGCERVELADATVIWRDRSFDSPIETELVASATVEGIRTGDLEPATFELVVRTRDSLDRARVFGDLLLSPNDLRLRATAEARGLRAGALAAYLPAGVAIELRDGRIDATGEARLALSESGGVTAEVAARGIELGDGDAQVLAKCAEMRLYSPRFRLAEGDLVLGDAGIRGVELEVRRPTPASISMLGVTIDFDALGSDAEPAPPADVVPETEPEPAPVVVDAPELRRPFLGDIQLEDFELELARMRFVDHSTGAPGEPLLVRGRLAIAGPTKLYDPNPEKLPPIVFVFDGAASPLVESVVAELRSQPWQDRPFVEGRVEVNGIRGAPLTAVLPELTDKLVAEDLVDGSFRARARADLTLQRWHPLDVSFERGFGVDLTIDELALRASPDGPVIAGIDGVSLVAPRVDPNGTVNVTSLEITTPRLHAFRDEAGGIHALGLTVLPGLLAPGEGAEPEGAARPAAEPEQAADVDPEVAAAALPNISLDSTHVQGIDFLLEDHAVDPPLRYPITDLYAEIERVSLRGLRSGRPVRLRLNTRGGEVELPTRHVASSALAGIVSSAGRAVAGTGDEASVEMRRLYGELAVQAELAMYPQPTGRLRVDLDTLELLAFRGEARAAGVDLADGVLDAGIDIRASEQTTRMVAGITFTHLDVSEGPGGPISTYLRLPAPLQSVVFALKDEAGEINVPLDVEVEGAELGGGQVAGAAVEAFGSVAARAIAAAPLRLTGTVTGLVGLTGGEDVDVRDYATDIEFSPVGAEISRHERAKLEPLVELVANDDSLVLGLEHHFGSDDVAPAQSLANPSPESAFELVGQLRQRRDALHRERAEAIGEARARSATGTREDARLATARVRAIHRELAETERALDRAAFLLEPDADRYASRRTRTLAKSLADLRLTSVRRSLVELGGPGLASRIQIRRPRIALTEGRTRSGVVVTPGRRRLDSTEPEAR